MLICTREDRWPRDISRSRCRTKRGGAKKRSAGHGMNTAGGREGRAREGGGDREKRPVQRPGARSAVRCTQSTDNGRRSAEQCGIQATSQCGDQRNNERSHCGLQADARPRRAATAERAAPLLAGPAGRSGAESARISDPLAGSKLTRSVANPWRNNVDVNFERGRDGGRKGEEGGGREGEGGRGKMKSPSIIPIPVRRQNRYSPPPPMPFDARNFFATTLNEALCRHVDNPQDSLTMPSLWTSSSRPRSSARGHITHTLAARRAAPPPSRVRGNFVRNFVLRRLRVADNRQ